MFLPSEIRKILAVLRGQVSPVLGGLAVGLGFLFGLVPGFSGIHAVLVVLLVLLNIPIGMFIVTAGVGKAAALAIAPALYHIGLFVQVHLQGLLDLLAKVPILGMTDFKGTPAKAGALVLGPVIGLVLGLAMARLILLFRHTWLKLEENHERFARWQNRRWVRVLDWLILSASAKDAKTALAARTIYVRKGGIVLAVLLVIVFGLFSFFFRNEMIRTRGSDLLTQANGATVDIAKVDFAPASGRFAVSGIGLTDRAAPTQDSVYIGQVSAQASVYELSLGRVVMDRVLVSDLGFDRPRSTPGKVLPRPEDPNAGWSWKDLGLSMDDLTKLDQYMADAKKLKAWFDQIRPYLPSGKAPEQTAPHKYLEYLTATVARPAFRVLAKEVVVDKVSVPGFGESRMTLTNLSDAPTALGQPIRLALSDAQGPKLDLGMHFDSPQTAGKVSGTFEGLDLATVQAGLNQANALNFESGKASGRFEGRLTQELIDLSLSARLSDLKASTGGKGLLGLDEKTCQEVFKSIKDLEVGLRVVGTPASPRVVFDEKGLLAQIKDKVIQAGKQKAVDEINKQIDKKLGDKVPSELKGMIKSDAIDQGLKGLFGRPKDPNAK